MPASPCICLGTTTKTCDRRYIASIHQCLVSRRLVFKSLHTRSQGERERKCTSLTLRPDRV